MSETDDDECAHCGGDCCIHGLCLEWSICRDCDEDLEAYEASLEDDDRESEGGS
jgi:hypothetical protein